MVVNASCRLHPPPMPLKVTDLRNIFPPVVTVFPVVVASKLTGPPKDKVMPGTKVRDPYILKRFAAGPVNVGLLVTPVQFISLQSMVKGSSVTVCPDAVKEFTSKKTSSNAVGIWLCSTDPPDAVAQWLRSVQLPVPPIQ